MYDVHCHIIFGVDDGAGDIEDSFKMCKAAAGDRIKAIIATPHFIEGVSEVSPSKILAKANLINRCLKENGIDLTILPGMEIYINPNLAKLYEEDRIILWDFFKKYRDRIVFGTDSGVAPDKIDEYLIQGFLCHARFISQLRLPFDVLQEVAYKNAERLFGIKPVSSSRRGNVRP
jgi:hypothetical protein